MALANRGEKNMALSKIYKDELDKIAYSDFFTPIRSKGEHDGIPTVIIGVGGTGTEALKRVKKLYMQEVKSSKNIAFLSVDTSKIEQNSSHTEGDTTVILKENEKINLTAELEEILKNHKWDDTMKAFLVENRVDTRDSGDGGQRRILGKIKLWASLTNDGTIDKLSNILNEKIHYEANKSQKGEELRVIFLVGLAGGTGSGSSIDLAYLIRAILNQEGKNETRYKIYSYLFMDDVVPQGVKVNPTMRANVYGYLKELEYLSNMETIKETHKVDFPGGYNYTGSKGPYDDVNLLSRSTFNDYKFENSYEHVLNLSAQSIIDLISKSDST